MQPKRSGNGLRRPRRNWLASNMDMYIAIRLQALRDVLNPGRDVLIRRIHRWYSKTFNTPLSDAYDLPLEDILQAYFEEKYEQLDEADLERERRELTEPPELRRQKMQAVDAVEADDDEFIKMVQKQEAEKALKKAKEPAPQNKGFAIPKEVEMPRTVPQIPPDIQMIFEDPEEFEAESDRMERAGDRKR